MPQRIAGDFDYNTLRHGYTAIRQPDPRIAAYVHQALGDARTVLNVGAGAGSSEPDDRYVVAVEPSAAMRAQRPSHRVPAIDAIAESLPFDHNSFDAAMAMSTVHQWSDMRKGLAELRRVARGPVVILTFDPAVAENFWLTSYVPELSQAEKRRHPPMHIVQAALGGVSDVHPVPIPIDCTDGFTDAFYARPEKLLDPTVRAAQSTWSFVEKSAIDRFVTALRADLESGEWDRRFGEWRTRPYFEGSLRLIVGLPGR
jgi:hypothetical protein